MQDRLRRLDSLFAEKVLGCAVRWQADGPWCGCENGKPHQEWGHGDIERLRWDDNPNGGLLLFTRSLDAAWEGATKLGWEIEFNRLEGADTWKVWIEAIDSAQVASRYNSGVHAHPAEALCLACLRAVGVSEEELA